MRFKACILIYLSVMFLRLLYFSLLLIAVHHAGYSQNFIFNRLYLSDGLLSNNILTVSQDKNGYIWLGTENGLQRYDGSRFRTIFCVLDKD